MPREENSIICSQVERIRQEKPLLKKTFQLKKNSSCRSPFVTGFFHPVIVLPDMTLSEKEWYYILSHETAHYLHGDTLYKLLMEMLSVIYWWNPLIHFFRKQVSHYLEEGADLTAVDGLDGKEMVQYLECLLSVAKACCHSSIPSFGILTFDGYSSKGLKKRFEVVSNSIFEQPTPSSRYFRYAIISALFLFTLLSYSITFEPMDLTPPTDAPKAFMISENDNCYAIKINDNLYESQNRPGYPCIWVVTNLFLNIKKQRFRMLIRIFAFI